MKTKLKPVVGQSYKFHFLLKERENDYKRLSGQIVKVKHRFTLNERDTYVVEGEDGEYIVDWTELLRP